MTPYEPWTPASVREVAVALFGPTWQTLLADAITEATGLTFTTVRIRHWYLSKNRRPIPGWLQDRLTPIFVEALLAHDRARDIAVRELNLRSPGAHRSIGIE